MSDEMIFAILIHERNALTFSTSRILGLEANNHDLHIINSGTVRLTIYKVAKSTYRRLRKRKGVNCHEGQ